MNNNQISTPVMIAIVVVALLVIFGGGFLYMNHRSHVNLGANVTDSGGAPPQALATFHKAYPGMPYPGTGGGSGGTQYPAGYPGTTH